MTPKICLGLCTYKGSGMGGCRHMTQKWGGVKTDDRNNGEGVEIEDQKMGGDAAGCAATQPTPVSQFFSKSRYLQLGNILKCVTEKMIQLWPLVNFNKHT